MVQRAIDMILAGARFITTNRDPSLKKRDGITWALRYHGDDRRSNRKKGLRGRKPGPVMMRSARKALGLETAETTVIGDTMDTDIQAACKWATRLFSF